MYSVTFISDSGKQFVFGVNGNTAFDMDIGSGVSVELGTSQGFSQVGETVETQSVTGRTINVNGAVYGNVQERKQTMRNVLAPFVKGKLVFGDYYIRVYVKTSPTFSTVKNDGRFTMQFFAPFPFFMLSNTKSYYIGDISSQFRFPINYATPHRFGTRMSSGVVNAYNDGDVKVPYNLHISSSGTCTNVTVTNMTTFAFIRFNGTLNLGETIDIYWEDGNVIRAELTSDGVITDVISWIDEDSTLFELEVGDNLLSATDDEKGAALTLYISFSPAVVAVYEA